MINIRFILNHKYIFTWPMYFQSMKKRITPIFACVLSINGMFFGNKNAVESNVIGNFDRTKFMHARDFVPKV